MDCEREFTTTAQHANLDNVDNVLLALLDERRPLGNPLLLLVVHTLCELSRVAGYQRCVPSR